MKNVALGIDLGTSNSSLAVYGERGSESILIPQLISSDARIERPVLPSVLFSLPAGDQQPAPGLIPAECLVDNRWVFGAYAQERGRFLPGRYVSSSKSWLCSRAFDRKGAILPWHADEDVQKTSPYDAAVRLLSYLRGAADAQGIPTSSVVLTIPASFEESARALTHEAAVAAGFDEVILLEEPLAALYAWLERHAESWRSHLTPGDIIVVCDVGGGTSDFSLIAVTEESGELAFRRISVGEHILLGGDNMDLALAHILRQRLVDQGNEIDQWQFLTLVQGARAAKEALFGREEMPHYTVSVPSRGSSLFGGSVSITVQRAEIEQSIVEGFFPLVLPDALPKERRTTGLREAGLVYAYDAAITRHLAAFFARSSRNAAQSDELKDFLRDGAIRPTKVLFNGGVFIAEPLRARVREQLQAWNGDVPIAELPDAELECGVARGAAYYGGVVARGGGLRIRAGLSRSYYIGVEPSELAVPGFTVPLKGVCIAPQGLEEGSSCTLTENEFVLATGEEISFPLFSSAERAGDEAGTEVTDAERELHEAGAITARIDSTEPYVPVVLTSRLSEVGMLELALTERGGERAWKFSFDVRTES
jgi:hypothetical protein